MLIDKAHCCHLSWFRRPDLEGERIILARQLLKDTHNLWGFSWFAQSSWRRQWFVWRWISLLTSLRFVTQGAGVLKGGCTAYVFKHFLNKPFFRHLGSFAKNFIISFLSHFCFVRLLIAKKWYKLKCTKYGICWNQLEFPTVEECINIMELLSNSMHCMIQPLLKI